MCTAFTGVTDSSIPQCIVTEFSFRDLNRHPWSSQVYQSTKMTCYLSSSYSNIFLKLSNGVILYYNICVSIFHFFYTCTLYTHIDMKDKNWWDWLLLHNIYVVVNEPYSDKNIFLVIAHAFSTGKPCLVENFGCVQFIIWVPHFL